MNSSEQTSTSSASEAVTQPDAVLTPAVSSAAITTSSQQDKTSPEDKELKPFAKSESKSLGFTGRVKDMFSGKKLISTVMALGFIFTWSERMLTSFNTGFSSYRDIPKMIRDKNLDPLKDAGKTVAGLVTPGSDNNFLSKFSTGEKLQAMGSTLGLAQNVWFFTSSRSGYIPDGDTMLERLKEILKNPSRHVAQITTLWQAVSVGSIGFGRLMSGYRDLSRNADGKWIGFNPRQALSGKDNFTKLDKLTPLITGAAVISSVPIVVYSMLNMKKPNASSNSHLQHMEEDKTLSAEDTEGNVVTPVEDRQQTEIKPFARSQSKILSSDKENGLKAMVAMFSPSNLKAMTQYAVTKDPLGFTARTLLLGMDVGFFGVGLAKLGQIKSGQYPHKYGEANSPQWNKALANAKQSRNVGILGFVLTALYNMYVYDTLAQAYKKEQEKLKEESDGKVAR